MIAMFEDNSYNFSCWKMEEEYEVDLDRWDFFGRKFEFVENYSMLNFSIDPTPCIDKMNLKEDAEVQISESTNCINKEQKILSTPTSGLKHKSTSLKDVSEDASSSAAQISIEILFSSDKVSSGSESPKLRRSGRKQAAKPKNQARLRKPVKETASRANKARAREAIIAAPNMASNQSVDEDEPVTRWSKEDDVVLFRAFKTLIAQHNLAENDFYNLKGRMPEVVREVLATLLSQCNWKGHIYSLRTRIQKIFKSQGFTARETRKLRRLLKLERKGIVTLSYVLEQFPGKSLEMIQMYKQKNDSRSCRNPCI